MFPRLIRRLVWLIAGGLTTSCFAAAEKVEFEGALYHLFRLAHADYGKLELHWLGKDGQPLRDFRGLYKELAGEGKEIAFAMNAGIFEKGPRPCGLTICAGKGRCR